MSKPILKVSNLNRPPWGYDQHPEDDNLWAPNEEQLKYLTAGKKLLKEYSYEEVAKWLSKVTGRTITRKGLQHRLKMEASNHKKEVYYKRLIKQLEDAKKKYEKYKNSVGGTDTYLW